MNSPNQPQPFQRQQRLNRLNLWHFRSDELGITAGRNHRQAPGLKFAPQFGDQFTNQPAIAANGARQACERTTRPASVPVWTPWSMNTSPFTMV